MTGGTAELRFEPPGGTEVVANRPDRRGRRLIIELRSTIPAAPACPYCGAPRSKNGTRLIRFRDIPVQGHSVFIIWKRQKFICRACGRSSHDGHPAFDDRRNMTVRFIKWISENAKRKTFAAISKDAGTRDALVRNVFHAGESQLGVDISALSNVIAIELIELAGRLRPAIIDIKNRIVFDVYATADEYYDILASSFAGPGFGKITLLVADIALDHPAAIVKMANDVVISRSSVEREGGHGILAACEALFSKLQPIEQLSTRLAQVLFLRRRGSLKRAASQRLDSWKKIAPDLYEAYNFKERFMEIWETKNKWGSWDTWKADVMKHPKLDFRRVIDRIDSRWKKIIDYYEHELLAHFDKDLEKIIAIDEKHKTHSFAASRAALLTKVSTP